MSVDNAVRFEWRDHKWTRTDAGEAPAPPSFPPPVDACSLLTDTELEAAMGDVAVTQTPGLGTQWGSGNTGTQEWQSTCSYTTDPSGGIAFVSLISTAGSQTTRAEFDTVVRLMAAGPAGHGQPITVQNAEEAWQFADTSSPCTARC